MINKKFGLLVIAGMLFLSGCSEQEQPKAENEAEVEEQEERENTDTREEKEEETTVESEENEASEEELSEELPEAVSGAASDLLSNGEMTSFVFKESGQYSIFCEPHPVMQMTVLVEDSAEKMDKVTVDIADYEFGEETITIAPGTTIVWTNQDQVQHNVAIK